MRFRENKPALILIDVQKAFTEEMNWGAERNNKDAELYCGKILNTWRELNLPLFHIRHSSRNTNSLLHMTSCGFEFNENVLPIEREPIITKNVNSAFIGTNLKMQLDRRNIKVIVVIGLTTNHCVSTSVRMAANYGYETYVISDATAAYSSVGIYGETYNSDIVHSLSLSNLNHEFSTIWDLKKLMAEI
ncbi:MAG: cysteine hydrolase family protein [Prolixibacteraceae bacterium]